MEGDKVIRQQNGRFVAGTAPGPGRPPSGVVQLRTAIEQAVTPEHLTAIMRRAARMALEGNLAAMRFVVERSCGKPPEMPAEAVPLDIELPKLNTVANCTVALDRLLAAATAGTLDIASGKLLLDLVQTRMKSIELSELEQRLVQLEATARLVKP